MLYVWLFAARGGRRQKPYTLDGAGGEGVHLLRLITDVIIMINDDDIITTICIIIIIIINSSSRMIIVIDIIINIYIYIYTHICIYTHACIYSYMYHYYRYSLDGAGGEGVAGATSCREHAGGLAGAVK